MKFISFLHRVIASCFYLLFFLVPLIFSGNTSELFEFNKMWITFALTIIIMLAWISKMVIKRQFFLQRTSLDIPILLFLLSQCIATIFSLDRYVSFWGYYSRFNGGLLSTISYILLYYAFASNLGRKQVLRMLKVSLLSGLIVALWGLPAHFGYDPTCFVFRHTLDVSCWTNAFQPKLRIFSTLGQPDWMAAYLAVITPIAIAFGLQAYQNAKNNTQGKIKNLILTIYYLLLVILFYVDLLFTRARSGFIALWISLIFFFAVFFWMHREKNIQLVRIATCYFLIFVGLTFFMGTPIAQLDKFTFAGLQQTLNKQHSSTSPQPKKLQKALPVKEFGGTDSGKIRLFVWEGALKIWQNNPLFGTGVETFAFAYYKFRPIAHNMTSEWDYLYNKAHNEYLNYLATTGAFGLLTYLAIIGLFFYIAYKKFPKYKEGHYKPEQIMAVKKMIAWDTLLITGMIAGFISILISNFFGFSVVIINLYLFLIPAFVLVRERTLQSEKMINFPAINNQLPKIPTSPIQYGIIVGITLIAGFLLVMLHVSWQADTSYAMGFNLDQAGYFEQAHKYLQTAVDQKPEEAVFSDELSGNEATLATAYVKKDATAAAQLAHLAIELSNQTVANHPNNVVYWKNRVRLFYSLAQINQQYLPYAFEAIQQAHTLAPTDAKIAYNLGLLSAQTGNIEKGITLMQQTITLKPDYHDAYYALGLFYRQQAIDKNGKVINKEKEAKAVEAMHDILTRFDKTDKQAIDSLKNWGEQ